MENNNIEIRNLYINKIQKKINNLIHCTKLLNNLNNVINNQIGGMMDNNMQNSLQEAQELLKQQSIVHYTNKIIPTDPINDNEINDLNNTIKELQKFITELQNKSKNNNNSEEVDKLNKQIIVLNSELQRLKDELTVATEELKKKENELLAAQLKISDYKTDSEESSKKLNEIQTMLNQYNHILEELKKKLPIIINNEIQKFNNIIEDLKKILEIPDITNCKYIKIINKYKDVFNKDNEEKINILTRKLNGIIIKSGPDVNGRILPITPYPIKNQEESEAIYSLVQKQNELYETYKKENSSLIDNIKKFKYQFNRVNTLINQQVTVQRLTDNSTDFNNYFNIQTYDELLQIVN